MRPDDPTRWLAAPELEADFKAALREAVDPGPSAAQLRQLAERLGVSTLAEPGAPAVASAPTRWLGRRLAGRVALLCAPLIGAIAWWSLMGAPRAAKPRSNAMPTVERPVTAPEPAVVPPPEQAVQPAEPAAPEASKASHRRRRGVQGRVVSDPLAELALLRRARAALRSNPEGALQLTERHRREYSRGLLAEERELLAVEALLNLGRADEARARARIFEREFPGSAHLRRLHVIVSGVKQ